MGLKPKGWILIGMLLSVFSAASLAQVTTTQVADTVYHADGTPASGTVLISWPAFTTSTGQSIPAGSTSATIATGGALSVSLTPNAGSIPVGSYYTAVFHLDDGSVNREYWVVPVSSTPVKIAAIESTVLPTTVAMQTVSKAYVDTAIADAVTGHAMESSSVPYVLKAGDTMTGPLVLPADPVSPTQAADKNYVDESVAAVQSGLGQKVTTIPAATQTVTQPAGTELAVNDLNDVKYASQYVTGLTPNGIANAVSSADCAAGCQVKAEQNYNQAESYYTPTLPSGTHITDARGGGQVDSFLNPLGAHSAGTGVGEKIDEVSTISTDSLVQETGTSTPASLAMEINQSAPAGGSNEYASDFENPPYFKTGYSALVLNGNYNTQGEHVLMPENINCYGVGDCLAGSRFIYASGGWRDGADEGAHLYDTLVTEDPQVFEGACVAGCTTGSTSVTIREDAGGGTQGDGRFLIDKNPANEITSQSTGGQIINGSPGTFHATVQFSGTNFPVSVFLSTGQVIPSQSNSMAPGTVTFAIATSGMPSGYASSTSAIGNQSGIACVADQNSSTGSNYEMAPYTVVDSTHLTMTFNKPHHNLATLAFGGLCGYGIEETVDTTNNIRQVFPVIGSYSPTALYYDSLASAVLGQMNETGSFMNVSVPIASMTRSNGVVTVNMTQWFPYNLNGVAMTISGAVDTSYNGTFTITTLGRGTFSYVQAGPNSSTTGGTVSVLTGDFILYPMAEVLSVMNPASKVVDGQMTLGPNNVAWAANDPVEQPHFFQEYITADVQRFAQYVPRPTVFARAGLEYDGNNGMSLTGWSINNASSPGIYVGYGGTHTTPEAAYESLGIWNRDMNLTAGEQAVFTIFCNLHGCGDWSSNYNLFELHSNVGVDTITFAPQTSDLTIDLRGGIYDFGPSGLTAGTINVTNLNATNINGTLSSSSLPVFGPSGPSHSSGAVPDPGATAGSTRYLREDGTWAVPAGSGGSFSGTELSSSTALCWSPTSSTGTACDTGLSRGAAGTVDVGNGNAGDQSGTLKAATLSANSGVTAWGAPLNLEANSSGNVQFNITNLSNNTEWQFFVPGSGGFANNAPFCFWTSGPGGVTTCNTNTGLELGPGLVVGWASSGLGNSPAAFDTGLSRTGAGSVALGNGTQGDASGSLTLSGLSAQLYKGPATAPTGSCTAVGWAFSQDGHISFCNGSSWTLKM